MQHDLALEGFAFRLRPICDGDAAFVTQLRSDPALNRFLHETSGNLNDQIAWQSAYYQRENDYCFMLERRQAATPEGMISIYDIDPVAKRGLWGRWVLKADSLAAVECVWLIYKVAFELIGLESVYALTVADNKKVISFHDSCGCQKTSILPNRFRIRGQEVDAVEHSVTRALWGHIAPNLERLSQMTARRVLGA